MDDALEALYGRAHAKRGFRAGQGGSLDPSKIVLPRWLDEMKQLFPASVFETIQNHAIEQLGMAEMLANPEVLARLEPNFDLMKVLLAFRGRADAKVAEPIRLIVRKVTEEVERRLTKQISHSMSGSRNRFRDSQHRRMANFDAPATIRANLRHYRPDRRQILAERLKFASRQKRQLPWTILLCVDQSASMLGSLIHAVVMAAILSALPALKVKLVVFDTAVVDLTDQLADPVDLLLSVQLGGGTNIARAITYCEGLIDQPSRTVLALISDFEEGGSPAALMRAVRRLAEARVTLVGLAALDEQSSPTFDRAMAARLAEAGMPVVAMTPDRFAEWLSSAMK